MNCNKQDLSPLELDFQKAGTLSPVEGSFSYKFNEYDSLYCRFDSITARGMMQDVGGPLDETQSVLVKISGEPIRTMYYEPSYLDLGKADERNNSAGYLELHDLHEHLKKGVINYAPNSTDIEKTFNKIYDSKVNADIFNGVDIRASGNSLNVISLQPGNLDLFEGSDEWIPFDVSNPRDGSGEKHLEMAYSLHLDSVSPLKGLRKARKKHSVNTHISPNGELVVGGYGDSVSEFTASEAGGDVDYHIKSSGIRAVANTVKQVNIKGPIVHDSIHERNERDAAFWNPLMEDTSGHRLEMQIVNDSIDEGDIISVEKSDIEPRLDDLKKIGKAVFRSVQRQTNNGNIVINMNTSRTNITPKIKDLIKVEKSKVCGDKSTSFTLPDTYFVSGVEHRFDGTWDVTVDLMNIPENRENLSVNATFHDISSGQDFTYKELYGYELGEGPNILFNE